MRKLTLKQMMEKFAQAMKQQEIVEQYTPVKIKKDGRTTVVFWQDGTATAVKCGWDEQYNDYVAFCAALGKKVFGSNNALKRAIENCPVEVEHPVLLNDDGTPASIKCPDVRMSEAESVAVAPMKAKCYTFNISSVEVKDLD